MIKRLILSAILFVSGATAVLIAPPQVAMAADCEAGSFFGLPSWHKNLEKDSDCSIKFDSNNPTKTVSGILLAVFEILIRIAGVIAVVFVIVGGFTYITSVGEPEKAKNAKNTVLNALIGLAITLVAAPTVSFIASKLMGP